jgi:hypothetical protein
MKDLQLIRILKRKDDMDEKDKLNPSEEPETASAESETDARMQAELKELIELNEIQAGALKKIMSQLNVEKKNEDQS